MVVIHEPARAGRPSGLPEGHPVRTPSTRGLGPSPLGSITAAQRALVYASSHALDPSAKTPDAYSQAYQKRILRELEPQRAAAKRWVRPPAALTLRRAPHDMRLEDMRSHWVQSQAPRPYAPDEKAIPREAWHMGTEVSWSDPRNEQVRVDKGPSHRSYTPYELSSELFNYPRMAFVSTADPSRDLRPATQTFLSFDSAANVRTKSSLHPTAEESTGPAPAPAPAPSQPSTSSRRVLGTLPAGAAAHSLARSPTIRHRPQVHRPAAVTRHLSVPDEYLPEEYMDRRRHLEKNYSDLFGLAQPERSKFVRARPQEHQTWSWTDSTGGLQIEHTDTSRSVQRLVTPRDRKDQELKSDVFYRSEHRSRERVPTGEAGEWGCMKASWLDNASEIVRRRSCRDFGREETAAQRKMASLRSCIFEGSPFDPPARGNGRRKEEMSPSAKGVPSERSKATPSARPTPSRARPRGADSAASPRTASPRARAEPNLSSAAGRAAGGRPLTARARLQNLTLHKRAEGLY